MTAILKNPRDSFGMRGDYDLIVIDYRKELQRVVEKGGSFLAEIPCLGLEHRHGVCPLDIRHNDVKQLVGRNTIVDSLRTSIIDQATNTGTPVNLRVTMIGAGTSSAATSVSSTNLTAEYYRAAPTDLLKISATKLTAFWFYGTTVGNAPSDLQEWGIFAGGATATANSGIMIARFLQQFTKTASKTLSGQYDLTVV